MYVARDGYHVVVASIPGFFTKFSRFFFTKSFTPGN